MTPLRIWLLFFLVLVQAYIRFPEQRLFSFIAIFALHIVAVIGVVQIRFNFFIKSLSAGDKKSNLVALTFDDGPDPILTPLILDILKEKNIKATFFVIANRAKQYPDIVKRIFDEGHTVACHDLTHSNFSNFRTTKMIINNLNSAQDIIEDIIGKKPHLYRPPMGLTNPHYKKALKKLNLQSIGWNSRGFDAGNRRRSGIKKVANLAAAGKVILIHDSLPTPNLKDDILNAINSLIKSIEEKKLKAVTVDEIFNIPPYQ